MNKCFVFIALISVFYGFSQDESIETADSLYSNGNYSRAIEIYKNQKDLEKVYDRLAKSYVAIGNYDEALNYYKIGIETDSTNALLKYDYAKLLSKTKKFKEAERAFMDLVYIDYKNPNYHYELGLVLEQLNDSTDMNRFRSAYDLDHSHQKAIYKIAKYYLVKRLHDLSLKYIDEGLSTYQNNVELISLKAQNYYWDHQYRKASEWFEKLIELGEGSEFIYEKLSLCYSQFYEYEKAIEYRKRVLKLNPADAVSMYVIGKYYLSLKDYKNAVKYVTDALLILDRPLNEEYNNLGVIYNHQNKFKESIEMFKIALDEDPKDQISGFYLVRAQEEYFSETEAKINAYEMYRKKFPESPFSVYAAERIRLLKEKDFLEGNKTVDSLSKD